MPGDLRELGVPDTVALVVQVARVVEWQTRQT
jgi:hypothetical protein